jgi:hypothetical protein
METFSAVNFLPSTAINIAPLCTALPFSFHSSSSSSSFPSPPLSFQSFSPFASIVEQVLSW